MTDSTSSFRRTLKRIWPVLVSLGSAFAMLIAFFIPSVQDQLDRYEARKVIEQYVSLGDTLFAEDRFEMAERAYAKAYELSEEKRLDIEMKRLHAKISRIAEEADWGSPLPKDLEDVDFQYLLHLQIGKEYKTQRLSTLNSYGIFLAGSGNMIDSENAFKEAMALDSTDELAFVNCGNLMDQLGRKKDAEAYYKKALQIEPDNARTHFNLGLLYAETGEVALAEKEFRRTIDLDPADTDAHRELELLTKTLQKK